MVIAHLESVRFSPARSTVQDGHVVWSPVGHAKEIEALPQVFWGDGTPWREANLWLMERATTGEVDPETVQSDGTAVHAYARWLEETKTSWWDFPVKKADRCLIRYRKSLKDLISDDDIAASTASQRMRVVIKFYRWMQSTGLISPAWPMWRERIVGIRLVDSTGFERTLSVTTTDLSIANKKVPGERLEDGLFPVSAKDRDSILVLAKQEASEELFLMLSLGFFTGMRIGTIASLKVATLANAVRDPLAPNLWRIAVGPDARPSVATKFDVSGSIWITDVHLQALLEYSRSARRLQREVLAPAHYKDLLFLTRFGNPYTAAGSNKSSAINVEMLALRAHAQASGIPALASFKFHQSRCTFATELARILIPLHGSINVIALIKEQMLHRDESTTIKYIKFVERTPAKAAAANEFTRAFLGLAA